MAQDVIEVTQREVEIIEVIERGPVGPTGPQPDINYEVVSSARTLEAADLIAADTSGGAFTLTLPANPSNGDAVDIFDFSETFDTNPLTIARNGVRIESLEEDLVCNVEGAYFTLIYTGATRGWQILPRYGTSGGGGESILTLEGDTLYRGPLVNERLPIGTAGQILKVNSTATAPEWGAAPATGVTSVAVSGSDGIEVDSGSPITGTGTIALGVNAATLRSHINVADGANNYTHPNHSGEVTSSGDGATTIANDVVTNAKLSNVATSTIKGRATAGTGDPEDLSASQVRTILNVADGAEVNVQSNWTEADSGSDAFILNKPSTFTPTAHAASHAGGSDALTASDIGAAEASHTHALSDITDAGTAAGFDADQNLGTGDAPQFLGIYVGQDAANNVVNVGDATIVSESGLALSMENPNGEQVSMRWFSPDTTGTGNHWGFGCDTLSTNENNFFIWDFINNRPALWANGDTGNIVLGGEYAEGTLPAKVQVIGISPSTATLLGLDNKTAGAVALQIRAAISQSANLTEWLDSDGSVVASIDAGGNISAANLGTASAADIGTDSSQVAAGDHTHGNITNGGLVGTTANLPLKTGTGGIVEAGAFGTSAGEFAEGNHTHADLHTRSHAITSTSDHTAGNHKVFYSNGSGEVVELALGNSGEVLTSNGATSAPSFAAASGGVSAVGSTVADILSVSGSDLVADDLGADKLYGWDDSEGKAIGYVIGSGLSVSGDTLSATGGGVTTGSVDNAIIRADGTGGSTSQSSDIIIDDATTSTQANVAIVNNHSETNSSIVLTPKGTGSLIFGPKPTGTGTTGNARGAYAVDFGRVNYLANYVASGQSSAILGGENNQASGSHSCVAGGQSNNASGGRTFCAGFGNTASGIYSMATGYFNTSSAAYGATALGGYALADRQGLFAVSGGKAAWTTHSSNIVSQWATFIMHGKTTTNAAVELLGGDVNQGTARLTVPASRIMHGTLIITGAKSDGTAVARYMRQFSIKNVSGTTSLVSAVDTIGVDADSGTSISVTANDTNDALKVEVTGVTSETWRWNCVCHFGELTYGT